MKEKRTKEKVKKNGGLNNDIRGLVATDFSVNVKCEVRKIIEEEA